MIFYPDSIQVTKLYFCSHILYTHVPIFCTLMFIYLVISHGKFTDVTSMFLYRYVVCTTVLYIYRDVPWPSPLRVIVKIGEGLG